MAQMPTKLLTGLRDIFATHFDGEGLTDLALAMGIDYENLSGSTKNAKARELALYLWRHSKLSELAEVGPELRPDIEWAAVLGPYLPPGSFDEAEPLPSAPGGLDFRDLQKLVFILAAHPLFETPASRKSVLVLSGLLDYVSIDLNGAAQTVAANLLAYLNNYGEIAPGDTAIGRLLAYIAADQALPPAHKDAIAVIAAKYGIALE